MLIFLLILITFKSTSNIVGYKFDYINSILEKTNILKTSRIILVSKLMLQEVDIYVYPFSILYSKKRVV